MVTRKYEVILPENYKPVPLPGRDEWIADLLANADKQGYYYLGPPNGKNCCLGRYALLQGRLTEEGYDGTIDQHRSDVLSEDNPVWHIFGSTGMFPVDVEVRLYNYPAEPTRYAVQQQLTGCNDWPLGDGYRGLNFRELADIIGQVWADGGPIKK